MADRPTGVASCALCRYRAHLTADDDQEVASTLRRILVAHLHAAHPEQRLNGVPDLLIFRGFGEDVHG